MGLRLQQARYYRHVALSSMHLVGCGDEAKLRHTDKSEEFAKSYSITSPHPEFAARLKRFVGLTSFAALRACERLLL